MLAYGLRFNVYVGLLCMIDLGFMVYIDCVLGLMLVFGLLYSV